MYHSHLLPHTVHKATRIVISDFTARGLAVLCWSPWLILHNVFAECAKCRFSGQANTTWGPSAKRSPIQYGLNYIGAYVRTRMHEPEFEPSCNRVVAYWHTSQSPHSIWCSPTRPHCHWDWRIIGCAMAAERWVCQWYPIFPPWNQCLKWKFARTQMSPRMI